MLDNLLKRLCHTRFQLKKAIFYLRARRDTTSIVYILASPLAGMPAQHSVFSHENLSLVCLSITNIFYYINSNLLLNYYFVLQVQLSLHFTRSLILLPEPLKFGESSIWEYCTWEFTKSTQLTPLFSLFRPTFPLFNPKQLTSKSKYVII